MREQKTVGILLGQVPLANDDVLLEFFTRDFGRISIFARKFANSKKRALEVDYFRLIELEMFKKEQNFTLRGAKTLQVSHEFGTSYAVMIQGMDWLRQIKTMYFEEDEKQFFEDIIGILFAVHGADLVWWNICFSIKRLSEMGAWPHMGAVRGDVYYDRNGKIFTSRRAGMQSLSNTARQVCELFRRMDIPTIEQKIQNLPTDVQSDVQKFVDIIESIYE